MRYFILKIANNFREDMLIIMYRSLNKSIQNVCLQRSELRWTSFIVWQRIFFVRQQSVNIWQFKRYDFIIFTSYKLNIELNEQIFMNLYCSVLLAKLVVTCCSSSVRKNFSLGACSTPQFWLSTICSGRPFPAVEFDHTLDHLFEGIRVPLA